MDIHTIYFKNISKLPSWSFLDLNFGREKKQFKNNIYVSTYCILFLYILYTIPKCHVWKDNINQPTLLYSL